MAFDAPVFVNRTLDIDLHNGLPAANGDALQAPDTPIGVYAHSDPQPGPFLALNMHDMAEQRGLKIDIERLSKLLGVLIVPTVGHRNRGTDGLVETILRVADEPASVTWEPSGEPLEWQWTDGVLTATVSALHIHGVVVVT